MNRFAALFDALDSTTSINARVAAMADYFSSTPPEDAVWALFFLSGRRIKRPVNSGLLRAWTVELTGLPEWLVEESYSSVGDLGETIALLIDAHLEVEPAPPGQVVTPRPRDRRFVIAEDRVIEV